MGLTPRVDSTKGPAQLRSIRQVLINLGRREFIDYLQGILTTTSILNTIADNSSIHANGFAKLVLERRAGIALRLHIWEPLTPDQESKFENIHDHVWSFGSRVLIGGLGEQRFSTSRGGDVMDQYRYVRSRATLPPGRLELLGQVRLAMLNELSHPAGTVYHVDDATLHRAWSLRDGGYAATLVVTGSPRSAAASVYARTGTLPREDGQNAGLSTAAVRRLIGIVVEALQ
jgi:hypothetical protein